MESSKSLDQIYVEIEKLLSDQRIVTSEQKSISFGIQFKVSLEERSGVMRVYQNKKGFVKRDYSQIKDVELANLVKNNLEVSKNPKQNESSTKNDELTGIGFPVIGTDESGKGDYFGPLVVAGVYVDESSAKILAMEGVTDSKKLSDKKVKDLAKFIEHACSNKFVIIEISPEKYNNLYDQFAKEGKKLNTLLAWGHAKAIEELLGKVACEIAIADQFADEKFILEKLQEKGRKLRLIQVHKAERNIAVAAASILARARFLDKLGRSSTMNNIKMHKGASSQVVNTAKQIVQEKGRNYLRKVAKIHFKTTQKVLS